jgi:hypothetical protein
MHHCEMRSGLLILPSVIRHGIVSDSSNIFTSERVTIEYVVTSVS